MQNQEFYLTQGSLEQIAKKCSLFGASSQSNDSSNQAELNVSIRIVNPSPILQVVDLIRFEDIDETKSKSSNTLVRYGFLLYDGIGEITATIDRDLYDLVEEKENGRNLKLGSIFILNEYKLIGIKDFLTKQEYEAENNKEKTIICITSMTLIGYSYLLNKSDLPVNNTQTEALQQPTHTISELNLSHSKTAWSIKCKVIAKTLVREFENRSNGSKGLVQRFLFRDKTGQIECVAFNEFCSNDQIQNIEVNKYYIIKNADIKKAQTKLKSWPNQLSLFYEIQITKQTRVELCNEESSNQIDSDVSINNENINSVCISNDNDESRIKQTSKQEISNNHQKLYQKFTILDQLVLKEPDSLVDVIGIIVDIGEIKTIPKLNNLSIRNVILADVSNTSVSVAFWGKQAEEFSFKIGCCLLINKVKVTNYNGVSLSVMRISELLEMKKEYDVEICNRLIEWYDKSSFKENQMKKRSVTNLNENEKPTRTNKKQRK